MQSIQNLYQYLHQLAHNKLEFATDDFLSNLNSFQKKFVLPIEPLSCLAYLPGLISLLSQGPLKNYNQKKIKFRNTTFANINL